MGQAGFTALHKAALMNFLEVAELLLGAGASVDAKNNVSAVCRSAAALVVCAECVAVGQYGETALHRAKDSNHQQMVALLSRQ